MKPVLRFAPSPTGFLHIGSARTALFNWLFARRHGGQFLLRIEDTDRERSTEASVKTILDGMTWLGLDWDFEPVSQYARRERHAEVAREMVKRGAAYYCYAAPEELQQMRDAQVAQGLPQRYDGRWRGRDPSEAPPGAKPVIRLKAPTTGETTVNDKVKGSVTVQNSQLDDMILLRSDGVPTYMLAVVVDDRDMGVTHVIRGDDHFTNTFRQVQIYRAMDWDLPVYAHLPMILGPDGAKLSKRHGAPAVGDYRDKGYLPEAVRNYLLRLCWSHGDDEIITTEQALQWFDLEHIGTSPARFDFTKLDSVNAHYLRLRDDRELAEMIRPYLSHALLFNFMFSDRANPADNLEEVSKTMKQEALSEIVMERLIRGMPDLKPRAKTLVDLTKAAALYAAQRPLPLDDGAKKILTPDAKTVLREFRARLAALPDFAAAPLEDLARTFAEEKSLKLGAIAQPFRAALTGSNVSPPIFAAAEILGRDETLGRIDDALGA